MINGQRGQQVTPDIKGWTGHRFAELKQVRDDKRTGCTCQGCVVYLLPVEGCKACVTNSPRGSYADIHLVSSVEKKFTSNAKIFKNSPLTNQKINRKPESTKRSSITLHSSTFLFSWFSETKLKTLKGLENFTAANVYETAPNVIYKLGFFFVRFVPFGYDINEWPSSVQIVPMRAQRLGSCPVTLGSHEGLEKSACKWFITLGKVSGHR
jgi:hypothetical protein